jgi:GDP-L-fucose synthase
MNLFKDKHILVTGGSGMVGRELVQLLLDRDAIVRVVSLDEPIDFFEEVEFIKKDLTNWHNCIDICTGMDYVFHVAGVKSSAT